MQTLVFNTTEKTITLTEGHRGQSTIIQKMENVMTVKCSELGFYEVMQKPNQDSKAVPFMSLPISNTNMFIVS
jgi:hypothetical protein